MTGMTNPLEGLTDREREQLRYIVGRLPDWPIGAQTVWALRRECVFGVVEFEGGARIAVVGSFNDETPDFTRAQYDAMKAEIEAQEVPGIDYRAHCEALARNAELLLYASEHCGESGYGGYGPTPWEEMRAALTRWREDSK